MANIKKRQRGGSSDGRGTYTTGGWQACQGPGVLLYAVMDGATLSSNVLTLYDGISSTGALAGLVSPTITVATWTQDTDFGTTVPVACFKDGSVVATLETTSANTHLGVPFADGLFVNKTGDVTNDANLTFIIKPLIMKSVRLGLETSLGTYSATDNANLFDGPGIVHGIRITTSASAASLDTADLLFKDSNLSGTGNTLITATNYGATRTRDFWSPVTTTGIDDAGTAVTTGATGSYTNSGVAFLTGLHVNMAQGSTTMKSFDVEVLIEA